MAVYDLFSKRMARANGEVEDVYCYDRIHHKFRNQFVMLLEEYYPPYLNVRLYEKAVKVLRKELGLRRLASRSVSLDSELFTFLEEAPAYNVIDTVEIFCKLQKKDFIDEVNIRLKESSIGYQFNDGFMIRIDSTYMHSEVVIPAISLLNNHGFQGVQNEFLEAHEHYRRGETKAAMVSALKAMESMMKTICEKRGWAYGERDTCSKLIDVCFKNDLIPSFWQSEMSALRSLLESGVPTARNQIAGHGQGASPVEVPSHIAGYVMHMTAAALVFLGESDSHLDK